MILTVLLCGLLTLVLYFYVHLKNGKKYWQSRGVLSKPAHFFFGHLNGVGKSVHLADRITAVYNEFKGKDKICGMYFINRPLAIVLDLELVRDICIKEFSKFHDRGVYVNEESDPLTAHLFALPGAKWKTMRNKLSPTFTSGKLKMMCPTIVNIADRMREVITKQISNDKTFDTKLLCIRYSTDVITTTAFGLDANTLENDDTDIMRISSILFKSSALQNLKFFFINSYVNLAHKLGLKLFPDVVSKYFMTILRETVENREQGNVTRNDFIDLLIKIKNSGTVAGESTSEEENFVGKITFNELAAQAFIFFFAGYETSATAMSYCLLEVAQNQEVQDRVRNEIQSVMKKHDNRLTYEGVVEMTYLEQCFNEGMRLYPPAHALLREVTEDYKVPGTEHVLEKGTQLFIPSWAIHRDETIFPDPMTYDPDRFTPENIKTRHPYAFLPFGEGPRICIGNRFALLQSKIALASILSNFRVTLNAKTKLPVELIPDSPHMGVRGGIWLDFEKI